MRIRYGLCRGDTNEGCAVVRVGIPPTPRPSPPAVSRTRERVTRSDQFDLGVLRARRTGAWDLPGPLRSNGGHLQSKIDVVCSIRICTRLRVLDLEVLVRELLAVDRLAARAVAGREVAALAHELRDDAVEGRALEVQRLAGLSGALLARAERAEVVG